MLQQQAPNSLTSQLMPAWRMEQRACRLLDLWHSGAQRNATIPTEAIDQSGLVFVAANDDQCHDSISVRNQFYRQPPRFAHLGREI